jgi:putative transposase
MFEQENSLEAVFSITLHVVLATKNRQNVLRGNIKVKLREIIREICDSESVKILEGNISTDYVHIVILVPPKININKFLLLLKGKTTYKLLATFESLRQRYRGKHLWSKGCFCCSSGNITEEDILKFVEQQVVVEDQEETEEQSPPPW